MDYVKFLAEQYIKTGRKGYTVYDADIATQRQLKEQEEFLEKVNDFGKPRKQEKENNDN